MVQGCDFLDDVAHFIEDGAAIEIRNVVGFPLHIASRPYAFPHVVAAIPNHFTEVSGLVVER